MLFFEDFSLQEITIEIIEIAVTKSVPYSPTYSTADNPDCSASHNNKVRD